MNDVLLETVVAKLENQERKIQELLKHLQDQTKTNELVKEVKTDLAEIRTDMNAISFPTREMKELSANLVTGVHLLRQPVKNEVVYHHYLKIRFIIFLVFFIGVIVAGFGWYMNWEKLDNFVASDTKYRYLKLLESQSLRQLLYQTDSIYQVQPDLRDSIIFREAQIKYKLETLQQARDKEEEARQLRKKIGK